MRSLGWLKFRYICIHRILCITHKAIHRGFPLLFRVRTDPVGSATS